MLCEILIQRPLAIKIPSFFSFNLTSIFGRMKNASPDDYMQKMALDRFDQVCPVSNINQRLALASPSPYY
jgi:hypothetical protein